MKKLLLTSIISMFFALFGFSQTHIAVQNNGEASFYGNFADALAAAAAGDTIYLPGVILILALLKLIKNSSLSEPGIIRLTLWPQELLRCKAI